MDYIYKGPIRLVLFDIDGVLTDGSLYIDSNGEKFKKFNVRDGLAVALLRAHGIRSGIISGKSSPSLDYRIQQLNFDIAITGKLEKIDAYSDIKQKLQLSDQQIAYIGDDVIDLPLAGVVGCFYAPADAHSLVLKYADHILCLHGGCGVGREVAEHILQSTGMTIEQVYQPLIHQWSKHNAVQ